MIRIILALVRNSWYSLLPVTGILPFKKSRIKFFSKVTALMHGQDSSSSSQLRMILSLISYVFCQNCQIMSLYVKNSTKKNNASKPSPVSLNFTRPTSISLSELLIFLRNYLFLWRNMTSYLTDIRNELYFEYGAWKDIFVCFDHYATSELSGKN